MISGTRTDIPNYLAGSLERIAKEAEELRNRKYQPYVAPEFRAPTRAPSGVTVSASSSAAPIAEGEVKHKAERKRRALSPQELARLASEELAKGALPTSAAPIAEGEVKHKAERKSAQVPRKDETKAIREALEKAHANSNALQHAYNTFLNERKRIVDRGHYVESGTSEAFLLESRMAEINRQLEILTPQIHASQSEVSNIQKMLDLDKLIPPESELKKEAEKNPSVLKLLKERELLQAAKTPEEYFKILQELKGEAVREAPRSRPFRIPFSENARIAPIPEDMLESLRLGRELGTYKPHLNMATQHAGKSTQSFPQGVAEYMNPYQQRVIDRIREEGIRTLREGILPELEGKFIGAGHHGSSRHAQLSQRAAREMMNEITGQQSKALSHGYEESARMHSTDKARQLDAAKALAHIGGQKQVGRLADIGALENQARYLQNWDQLRRNMAYEQYQREENAPWEALERQSAILHGMPYNALTSQRSFEIPTQSTYVPSTMGNIGQLAGQLYGLSRMVNQ